MTKHRKPFFGNTGMILIGGPNGKRVLCSSQAQPIFNNLEQLGKQGNHWARLTVEGIKSLSAGRLGQDNVFVEEKAGIAYGKGAFYVVLPGVLAIFEELPNGYYILQHIKQDSRYQQLEQLNKKTGLYGVNKDNMTTFKEDNRITDEKFRPVVISDMAINDAQEVADSLLNDLIKTNQTIKTMVESQGFDMHYTAGDRGIVGLKSAQQALASAQGIAAAQSSILLADSMYHARDIDGVMWYSDWGGSGVLLGALEILHRDKGITLNNHVIYMNRPTTPTARIVALGQQLKLNVDMNSMKTGLHPKELKGHILVNDIAASKHSVNAALNTAGFGVSALGAGFAIAGAATTVASGIGLAGAMFFVAGAIKAGSVNFKGKPYK